MMQMHSPPTLPSSDIVEAPHGQLKLEPSVQRAVRPSVAVQRWLNEQEDATNLGTGTRITQPISTADQRFQYLARRFRILEDHIFRRNYPNATPNAPLTSANGDVKSDFICVRNVSHLVGENPSEALEEALQYVYGIESLDERNNFNR
jgi:hypothetical protein